MGNNNRRYRNYNHTAYSELSEHKPQLPQRLPLREGQRRINVWVEGYEDIAFWRSVFDEYESEKFTFEISVPPRNDLAKGKKIVLNMASKADVTEHFFCVDSDFDYIFDNQTNVAQFINTAPNVFHTYVYAIENFLCYAPTLHNVCVRATKNDTRIFDFEKFLKDYSKTIYPLFLWYALSAHVDAPSMFTLQDFKSSVKINYLELDNNGENTLKWLERQVERRMKILRNHHPDAEKRFPSFIHLLKSRGVNEENAYLYMQGHTLMDNVVMPVVDRVCDRLKYMATTRINTSERHGLSLSNEQSNYNNALRDIRNALLFNESYKEFHLYKKIKEDIERHLNTIG